MGIDIKSSRVLLKQYPFLSEQSRDGTSGDHKVIQPSQVSITPYGRIHRALKDGQGYSASELQDAYNHAASLLDSDEATLASDTLVQLLNNSGIIKEGMVDQTTFTLFANQDSDNGVLNPTDFSVSSAWQFLGAPTHQYASGDPYLDL